MFSDRNLIVVVVLCLVAVWGAAAFKINGNKSRGHVSAPFEIVHRVEAPITDSSFFENTQTVQKPPTGNPSAAAKPRGLPGVTARAYLVGNTKTGKIYLEWNAGRIMPVASMSKLVTAFVATDLIPASTTIEISEAAMQAPPDRSNLMAGEHLTLTDALQPLLLSSSNIVAEAIASSSDREKFMESMKAYAWEVGMPNSYFADPSGVSPKNVASARDLFGLAKYLMYYRPDILELTRVGTTTMATTTEHGSHYFVSTHPFVNDSRFIGGKTGRTLEAGETMLTIMNIYNQPIVIVVLGSDYGAREWDTKMLLNELNRMFSMK